MKRRQSKSAQFTVEKLDYTSHPWFTVPRIKALSEHVEHNLNYSWRKNNIPQEAALAFIKKQKAMEKQLVIFNVLKIYEPFFETFFDFGLVQNRAGEEDLG